MNPKYKSLLPTFDGRLHSESTTSLPLSAAVSNANTRAKPLLALIPKASAPVPRLESADASGCLEVAADRGGLFPFHDLRIEADSAPQGGGRYILRFEAIRVDAEVGAAGVETFEVTFTLENDEEARQQKQEIQQKLAPLRDRHDNLNNQLSRAEQQANESRDKVWNAFSAQPPDFYNALAIDPGLSQVDKRVAVEEITMEQVEAAIRTTEQQIETAQNAVASKRKLKEADNYSDATRKTINGATSTRLWPGLRPLGLVRDLFYVEEIRRALAISKVIQNNICSLIVEDQEQQRICEKHQFNHLPIHLLNPYKKAGRERNEAEMRKERLPLRQAPPGAEWAVNCVQLRHDHEHLRDTAVWKMLSTLLLFEKQESLNRFGPRSLCVVPHSYPLHTSL